MVPASPAWRSLPHHIGAVVKISSKAIANFGVPFAGHQHIAYNIDEGVVILFVHSGFFLQLLLLALHPPFDCRVVQRYIIALVVVFVVFGKLWKTYLSLHFSLPAFFPIFVFCLVAPIFPHLFFLF